MPVKHLVSASFVLAALAFGTPTRTSAADAAAEQRATELQKTADEALGRKTAAETALKAEQAKLQSLNDQLVKTKADAAQAENTVKNAEAMLKGPQEAVTKATAEKQKLDGEAATAKTASDTAAAAAETAKKGAEDAAKAAEAAKGTDQEKPTAEAAAKAAEGMKQTAEAAGKAAEASKAAADKAAAAGKTLEEAQAAVKKVEAQIAAARETVAKAPEAAKQLETQIAALTPAITQAQTALDTVSAEWLTKQKAAEAALIEIGKLVSFSHKIAPVFAKRCLACHNARTAKGRFNMETYAAIMKGGESGDTVLPGDGESSYLYIICEDGSMPKDADPLTKDEIALLKQWIDTGAKLDAGLNPDEPLITIMPKLPQPPAPESYRVPIPVTALTFSPDGNLLASSGYHEVILWNPNDGQIVRRITNVAERVYDLEFSPNGQTLAVAAGTPAQMGEVKLFNAADGALVADLTTSSDSIFAVAFSADGTRLASGGADRSIRIFDVASGKSQLLIEDHADWVMDVAWSPDGSRLASASRDKTSKVFDTKTGESVVTFNGHGQPVFGSGFTPDGKQVVTSGADRQLRVWNVSDAKQVRNVGGFGGDVFRIDITKEGIAYSASADKNGRSHNVTNGQAVKTFAGHKDWVYSIAFNPATKKAATGSYDGEIRIWNTDEGKELKAFVAAPGYKAPETTAAK